MISFRKIVTIFLVCSLIMTTGAVDVFAETSANASGHEFEQNVSEETGEILS